MLMIRTTTITMSNVHNCHYSTVKQFVTPEGEATRELLWTDNQILFLRVKEQWNTPPLQQVPQALSVKLSVDREHFTINFTRKREQADTLTILESHICVYVCSQLSLQPSAPAWVTKAPTACSAAGFDHEAPHGCLCRSLSKNACDKNLLNRQSSGQLQEPKAAFQTLWFWGLKKICDNPSI